MINSLMSGQLIGALRTENEERRVSIDDTHRRCFSEAHVRIDPIFCFSFRFVCWLLEGGG